MKRMKYGILMPHGGPGIDAPQKITEYAILAEKHGWDGFFIWDNIGGPMVDPWITLANIAVNTDKMIIGPMVTAIARRRPWQVAKSLVSLDQLSGGRIIFGAGLGDDQVFETIGELTDKKTRARKLDESLYILDKLLRGEKLEFKGEFYELKGLQIDKCIQEPRIPFWLGGLWPTKGPFKRAAKWEGMMPHRVKEKIPKERLGVDDIEDIMDFIGKHRNGSSEDYEMSMLSFLPRDKEEANKMVSEYHKKGVTWWVESVMEWKCETLDEVKERIIAGPPDYRN